MLGALRVQASPCHRREKQTKSALAKDETHSQDLSNRHAIFRNILHILRLETVHAAERQPSLLSQGTVKGAFENLVKRRPWLYSNKADC